MKKHTIIARRDILEDALDRMKKVMESTIEQLSDQPEAWLPGEREALTKAIGIGHRVLNGANTFDELDTLMRDWMVRSVDHNLHVGPEDHMTIDLGFEPNENQIAGMRAMIAIHTYPLVAPMQVEGTRIEIGFAENLNEDNPLYYEGS